MVGFTQNVDFCENCKHQGKIRNLKNQIVCKFYNKPIFDLRYVDKILAGRLACDHFENSVISEISVKRKND